LAQFHDLAYEEANGFHLTIFYIFGGFWIVGQNLGHYFGDFALVRDL